MNFILMPGEFVVCRFDPSSLPAVDFVAQDFISMSRSAEELSIVCRPGQVEGARKTEAGWRAFKIQGPMPFGLVGILAEASTTLASAGLGIFAISTYDTDYILVKAVDAAAARAALESRGHSVSELAETS